MEKALELIESNNQFTARLLLHHFLDEDDLKWLSQFDGLVLNDSQKRALIFVREAGAIDNATYRQISATDIFKASVDLRQMRDIELLKTKGKGRATYYVASEDLLAKLVIPKEDLKIIGDDSLGERLQRLSDQYNGLISELPEVLKEQVSEIGPRMKNKDVVRDIICKVCNVRDFSIKELSILLQRKEKYLLEHFISPLRKDDRLQYKYPDMPNHPGQTYKAV